jgi:Uma2 family endonuclease
MTKNRTITRNKLIKHLREKNVSFQIMDGRIIIMVSDGEYHYCSVDVIGNSLDWYHSRRPFTFYVICPLDTKDGIKAIDNYLERANKNGRITAR